LPSLRRQIRIGPLNLFEGLWILGTNLRHFSRINCKNRYFEGLALLRAQLVMLLEFCRRCLGYWKGTPGRGAPLPTENECSASGSGGSQGEGRRHRCAKIPMSWFCGRDLCHLHFALVLNFYFRNILVTTKINDSTFVSAEGPKFSRKIHQNI
jgi:hypothetical protein